MTSDDRLTWGLILNIIDALEGHGYHWHDNKHTSQAMGMIRDLAHVYEGTRDAPYDADLDKDPPAPHAEPGPPGSQADDAVTLTATDIRTIIAALDDASEYKRDRAETCADCADQSCTTCQLRQQAAEAYDQLAGHMTQAAQASTAQQRTPGHQAAAADPERPPDQEAGQ
jgi:hypothetical protein